VLSPFYVNKAARKLGYFVVINRLLKGERPSTWLP